MFSRLSTVVIAFTLFAGAMAGGPTKIEYKECNGGTVQCCNTTQDTKNFSEGAKNFYANLINVDVKQITGTLGLGCSGVKALAIGGGSTCTQQKVCFHPLI